MKKHLILPLSLLLSFVAIKASEAPAEPQVAVEATAPAVEAAAEPAAEPVLPSAPVVVEAAPVAAPAVEPAAEPTPVVAPVVEAAPAVVAPVAPSVPVEVAPVATPVVATVSPASATLPTEDDINKVLGLVAAYNKQMDVIKSLHDLAADDALVPNLPNEESVRSLLNLLELHKKEADLILALRASITSLQGVLGKWDADVTALLNRQKKAAKPKIAKRNLHMPTIKEINKPRGNN